MIVQDDTRRASRDGRGKGSWYLDPEVHAKCCSQDFGFIKCDNLLDTHNTERAYSLQFRFVKLINGPAVIGGTVTIKMYNNIRSISTDLLLIYLD